MSLSRPVTVCLTLGLGLFIAGFFLPAVRFPPDSGSGAWGPGLVSHEFVGYECAEVTLAGAAAWIKHPSLERISVALIGSINPLALLYLLCCAAKKLNWLRPILAGAIVVSCVVMWIFLATEHVTLLIGHYLWIAGIASMLAAPLADHFASQSQRTGNTT